MLHELEYPFDSEYILKKSMKNKELLKLLSLEKSLVYFTTSLKSNELVMEKTMRGKIIKLYADSEENRGTGRLYDP